MKKIIKNKKLLLLVLTVVLFLILLSTYIRTAEIELKTILVPADKTADKTKEEELLFEADQKNSKKETEKKGTKKEEAGIEKIALIKEIKDPFQKAEQQNKAESAAEKSSELKEQKVSSNQDLIFLERNIIAEEIIDQTQSREKINKSKTEAANKSSLPGTNSKTKEDKDSIKGQRLNSIRLPFKLLGIIKNSHNSSALFLYQGQTLLKKEKDKIDIFKIEKINNKNLIISYQNEERRLHLWEEKNNEK